MTTSQTSIDLSDERLATYGRLVETQRRLHKLFDASLRERAGMSIVEYEALLRLGRADSGHLPINELGEAMGLTSGGATRLVDRLEARGHVVRTNCPSDRRVSWAELTPDGAAALAAATEIHLDDIEYHMSSKLDPDDLGALRQLLRVLDPSR